MAIQRLLVANRGEIAVRVFRTCARLGIDTVAVFASDDRNSFHVRSADSAVELGSYLDGAEHVRAAVAARADAIHPGYGFLSENPTFAEAVLAAGITWVGPSPEALRLGGDKVAAHRIAIENGVPTLPQGSPGEIGFPLVVKAAAGGGGRGMRVVRDPAQLDEALAAARREAEGAFGNDAVFCERYLDRPRHIEAQLLGHRGGVTVLGGRDCSIQRRHQKLIEESPPPGLRPGTWARIEGGARAFAEAIGYQGAGTAEFLVSGDDVYFLELNGRIQVEHPVTEEVTGLDIVELQLRVAAGEEIGLDVVTTGHAIEARLYAEDSRTFLPQTGRLERLVLPTGVRVDAGVEEGDEIGLAYDPMIAKLIAHGSDRESAIARLTGALDATEIDGVITNLPFLRWLVRHPAFVTGSLSTAFLIDHTPLSVSPLHTAPPAFATPWRLNRPVPPPTAAPNIDAATPAAGASAHGAIAAPMPGTVLAVGVVVGDAVTPQQRLVVLEAMKMEMPVLAPFAATVTAVHVATGDQVAAGTLLVELG
ncbi:acetyl/propionyl/methylcrotonyl-CoA carboxylase subunit alpha [Gaiella sp.]|uniref:acetyl/propionyl/methylcrotonyl-CoA carboxylase subunit alpha n=1 Tax=Gaiella sp. TaxID=2663207 RepID=UPI0039832EE6